MSDLPPDDIVVRLRLAAEEAWDGEALDYDPGLTDAADTIERLRTQLSQALRELGEARERADRWLISAIGALAKIGVPTPAKARDEFGPEMLSSEIARLGYNRDAALRSTAEWMERCVKAETDRDTARADKAVLARELDEVNASALRSTAELRGALEEIDAEINRARRQFVSPSCNIISDAINRALASSSTRET